MTARTQHKIKQMGELAKSILAIMALAGAVMAFGWNNYGKPTVERMICEKTDPLVDAMELQNYLIMESMPDSLVERAIDKYTRMRNALKGVQR